MNLRRTPRGSRSAWTSARGGMHRLVVLRWTCVLVTFVLVAFTVDCVGRPLHMLFLALSGRSSQAEPAPPSSRGGHESDELREARVQYDGALPRTKQPAAHASPASARDRSCWQAPCRPRQHLAFACGSCADLLAPDVRPPARQPQEAAARERTLRCHRAREPHAS